MSDSVRPQPTSLPCPWDSPDKNTGVGCHFLLQCMKVKNESEVGQSCLTLLQPHGLQPTRLLRPWDSPGKSTGVGYHCLLRTLSLGVPKPSKNVPKALAVRTLLRKGDFGSTPGSGRSPGEGNGNPLHYACLENSMDRGAWQVAVHGVTKSQTQLSS